MRFIELTTPSDIELFLDRLPPVISLDTEYRHACPSETGIPDPRKAILTSIVISTDGDAGYSIPAHYVDLLKPLAKAKRIYLQNFKVDYEILGRYGVDLTTTP